MRTIFLILCKWLGAFAIARRITSGGLRILCYHGISIEDEHLFRPSLFVTPDLFRQRLEWLRKSGFPVLGLDDAVERLAAGNLPPNATVITFDDGWHSNLIAAKNLRQYRLPATFYVSSYYVKNQEPIFNLFVAYAIWRSGRVKLLWEGREQEQPEITKNGSELRSAGRIEVMKQVAHLTGVDYEQVAESRRFGLMNEQEIRQLVADGFDIELHTHRHTIGADDEQLHREISDNRAALEPLAGRPLTHFCYPSGKFTASTTEVLKSEQIASATTVMPGLNFPGADRYRLRRTLDSVMVSQIQFEAEMSGFLDLVRFLIRRSSGFRLDALPPRSNHLRRYSPEPNT